MNSFWSSSSNPNKFIEYCSLILLFTKEDLTYLVSSSKALPCPQDVDTLRLFTCQKLSYNWLNYILIISVPN